MSAAPKDLLALKIVEDLYGRTATCILHNVGLCLQLVVSGAEYPTKRIRYEGLSPSPRILPGFAYPQLLEIILRNGPQPQKTKTKKRSYHGWKSPN